MPETFDGHPAVEDPQHAVVELVILDCCMEEDCFVIEEIINSLEPERE